MADRPSDQLLALADEYWDGTMARAPFVATMFGDHRFDDQVPDLSPDGLQEHRSFVRDIAVRVHAVDGAELSPSERVTRALLLDACDTAVEEIDSDEIQLSSDGFTGYPVSLLRAASRRAAPDATSAEAQLRRLEALPRVLDDVVGHWRAGVERGWTPTSTIVARTAAMVEGHLAGPVATDPFVALELPDGWTGADDWRARASAIAETAVRPAYQRVADALRDLEALGRGDDSPGLCHLPDGDALYASLARRATTTTLTPDEIHAIGMEELTDKLPAEWAEIGARAVGISDREVLFDHLRTDPSMKYESARQILDAATAAIERALAVAPRWFAHLPGTDVVVEAVPDSLAPGSPPAYYGAPPADGSKPGVYYANTHEPTRRNRFEAEVFAFHEAVPGHHLERASAVELNVPMFQRRGGYMAYSEGWGLYTERLADEMGIYSSDLMRLGMLSADAWRSARLVIDTGLHAMGWTRSRAIDFMTAHVPIAHDEAAVEVDRYIGMPAQALSYKIGQREFFRLRHDAERRLGDDFDIRGFHHAVLAHGGVTLGILGDLVDAWVRSSQAT
ncbi:DUF885 domain-containing protein [Actinospongicola halichondriae]|uniref:DUF885 domain-containing protein n=1 Tax=Actinospongicola halichondriae TaxID=3236844 RepID=UPI003D511DBB